MRRARAQVEGGDRYTATFSSGNRKRPQEGASRLPLTRACQVPLSGDGLTG